MILECLVIEHFGVVSSVAVILQGLRFLSDWLAEHFGETSSDWP